MNHRHPYASQSKKACKSLLLAHAETVTTFDWASRRVFVRVEVLMIFLKRLVACFTEVYSSPKPFLPSCGL